MATVGMLYPGYSAEDEYPYLESVLGEGVRLPVVHTSVGNPTGETTHEVDALLDLGKSERLIEAARELQAAYRPDAIMWACTSGSFVFGWDGARRQALDVELATGAPTSSTSLAFAAAVEHLGLHQVAVTATYPDDVCAHFVRFMERAGAKVLDVASHDIPNGEDAGLLGHDEVLALVRSKDNLEAEAILVPDTALHTVRWINELEDAIGKTVLTANQVTAWYGLRLAGQSVKSTELGTLFRA